MNLKIGFIIDSSAGLTKKEATKKGLYFLPLIITINKQEYLDGQDITSAEYYKKIKLEDNVRTSATPPGTIESVIKKASKENDLVFVYAISEHLSSQTNNLKIFSQDFDNVEVVSSKIIGDAILNEIENIKNYIKLEKDAKKIVKFANEESKKWTGYLIPQNLDWLVKGGRVNAQIASMANLLKITPIIKLREGELVKDGKGRTYKKTSIKSYKKLLETCTLESLVCHMGNSAEEQEIYNKIKKISPDITSSPIPPIIANHTGPHSIIMLGKMK